MLEVSASRMEKKMVRENKDSRDKGNQEEGKPLSLFRFFSAKDVYDDVPPFILILVNTAFKMLNPQGFISLEGVA